MRGLVEDNRRLREGLRENDAKFAETLDAKEMSFSRLAIQLKA